MIASDTLFDSRGWVFGIKLSEENIVEIECLKVVAMATNFGTKIALTGIWEWQQLGNWSWRGFEWSADRMQILPISCTQGTLPWHPFFGFLYIYSAHWHHLANTNQPSMCGGDAALCQITLITCCIFLEKNHHLTAESISTLSSVKDLSRYLTYQGITSEQWDS